VHVLAPHAGISMGFSGTSHHAVEDIALTRSIAGLDVVAPCDATSLRECIRHGLERPAPMYLRLGRGNDKPVHEVGPFERGRFVRVRDGADATVVATGICVHAAITAADRLARRGVGVRVLDAVYLKPLDVDAILAAADETGGILTAEEHNVIGGLGSAVAETLALHGRSTPIAKLGIEDEYALVAPPTHLYRHYGLTADGVEVRLRGLLGLPDD
jgi:transketolase